MNRRIAALILGSVILIGLFVAIPKELPEGDGRKDRTTLSTRPEGLKALYLALPRLGFRVGLWRRPWKYLPKDAEGVLLFIVDPDPTITDDPRNWSALLNFVKSGNGVWLSSESPSLLNARFTLSGAPSPAMGMPPLPTLSGVRNYRLHSRLRLTEGALPNVWANAFKGERSLEVPLLADERGVVVKALLPERGVLILDANPSALTNARILEGDNALAIVAVLDTLWGGGRVIWFDEWCHGYGETPHWWWVAGSGLKRASLHLLMAGVLFLLSVGVRVGPPKLMTGRGLARSTLTDALANLLRKGRTRKDLIRWFRLHFWRRLVGHQAVYAEPDERGWRESLAELAPDQQREVEALLNWSKIMETKENLKDDEILQWVRRIYQLRATRSGRNRTGGSVSR